MRSYPRIHSPFIALTQSKWCLSPSSFTRSGENFDTCAIVSSGI